MKNVRSSQASTSVNSGTELSKIQFFTVQAEDGLNGNRKISWEGVLFVCHSTTVLAWDFVKSWIMSVKDP